ncbi:YtxH domain-containing protein [Corallococcus sp. H22C18031201]|uniref:YtxH domain-containing protein n=1 Tax=Citreicoccus inhibens TaxID=2849499 RepID=UPI000E764217|nr:YtxH domain-containing protein [Citreicoccus inhibens]MBU8894766.1 YtxH domain-containing protein [Citreicoccus inhibens]RJS17619.1 YtxH domain-containing protein [Corallococcus sp. H22C18031201]
MFETKKAKWMAKGIARSDLYRRYLAHKLLNQFPRYAKAKWDDFDPDDALHHVGLTTYRPGRSGLGGLGLFVLGAALGSVVGLMMAPRPGTELRNTVKDKAMGYLNKQGVTLGSEKTASA